MLTEYRDYQKSFTNVDKIKLINFIKFMRAKGHNDYEQALLHLFNKPQLPKRNQNNIIEQAIQKSINDFNRNKKDINYYVSNALCFLEMSKQLTSDIEYKLNELDKNSLYIHNYSRLFRSMHFDSIELLKMFEEDFLGKVSQFTLWKPSLQHIVQIYQFLRFSIFGQLSFHSHSNLEIDMSILIIRQLVELRIRNAFGLLGLYNKKQNSAEPLPMNILFEAINEVASSHNQIINFSVPISNLYRIYSWANIFTHSGIKAFTWLPIKCTYYLKDFCLGKEPLAGKGFNIYNGISFSQCALDLLKQIILKKIDEDHYELIELPPKAIINK